MIPRAVVTPAGISPKVACKVLETSFFFSLGKNRDFPVQAEKVTMGAVFPKQIH